MVIGADGAGEFFRAAIQQLFKAACEMGLIAEAGFSRLGLTPLTRTDGQRH